MQELVKIIHHILSQHYHKLFIEYFNKFQQIRQQTLHRIFQQVSTRWMSRFSFTAYSTNYDTFLHHIFNKQTFNKLFHNISSQHSSTNSFATFFATFFNNHFDKIFNDKLHDEDYSFQQMYSQIMIQCSSHAL